MIVEPNNDIENISNISQELNNSDGELNFKEMYTKAINKELTGHKRRVYALDWNLSGRTLASGSVDTCIRVFIHILILAMGNGVRTRV
jgi:hypothetical protein